MTYSYRIEAEVAIVGHVTHCLHLGPLPCLERVKIYTSSLVLNGPWQVTSEPFFLFAINIAYSKYEHNLAMKWPAIRRQY